MVFSFADKKSPPLLEAGLSAYAHPLSGKTASDINNVFGRKNPLRFRTARPRERHCVHDDF